MRGEVLEERVFERKKASSSKGLKDNCPRLRFPEFVDDWNKTNLGSICKIIMGQSPDSASYNNQKKGLPLVQGNADIKERKSYPQRYTSNPIKTCEKGSILLSVRAPVGTVGVANQNLCIGRGICAIQYENNEFIYQYLLKHENSWKNIEQGGIFTSINSNDIKNFSLFIPEKQERNKISTFLSLIDKRIDKQKELIKILKYTS